MDETKGFADEGGSRMDRETEKKANAALLSPSSSGLAEIDVPPFPFAYPAKKSGAGFMKGEGLSSHG
jgi:hypothetical protein